MRISDALDDVPRAVPRRPKRGCGPLESFPQAVTRLKSWGFCAVRFFVEKIAFPVLTASRGARINRSNDGGAAAGDEILRPPILRVALKKGLANGIGKVLKVDSFGQTEGTCQVVRGNLDARCRFGVGFFDNRIRRKRNVDGVILAGISRPRLRDPG